MVAFCFLGWFVFYLALIVNVGSEKKGGSFLEGRTGGEGENCVVNIAKFFGRSH